LTVLLGILGVAMFPKDFALRSMIGAIRVGCDDCRVCRRSQSAGAYRPRRRGHGAK
jgi:hypothetical protein